MNDLTIWHNPRCSKSRETLALLKANGHTPVIRLYLTDPPDAAEISACLDVLGINAIDLMRVKEKQFKELGLSKELPSDRLIAAMAENPVLIERPIVFSASKAAIGRPPEAVLAIL
jgi:arsenate reductase